MVVKFLTMNGQQKTLKVAVALVLFSLANIAFVLMLTEGMGIAPRAVRLLFTCVLAFFLLKGANWSRWFVAVLSILSVILSIIGFFGLSATDASMFSIFGLWMLAMAAFYAWVAYMLLADKDVGAHFSPPSGL